MEDRDRDDAPSLEPPSLFRRKRRTAQPEPTTPVEPDAPGADATRVDVPVTAPDDTRRADPVRTPSPSLAAALVPDDPRVPREPLVTGMAAACGTGLVVGLGTVGLTWGSLRLCDAARGTSTCGGGPGFLLLLAILVGMVLLGSALLRACRVPDAGSTSFLAVGLLTVVVLLFLVDVLFSWTMVVVVPVVAIACFALSYWVTTTFVETDA